jgi:hypothetical protein
MTSGVGALAGVRAGVCVMTGVGTGVGVGILMTSSFCAGFMKNTYPLQK